MGNDLGWAWKGPSGPAKTPPKKRKGKKGNQQPQKKPKKNKRMKRKDPRRKSPSRFYKSWEWKKARYKALQRYGAICMCCGVTPADGKVIVVDHILPVSKYPEKALDQDNLQVLCNDCNMGKSNDDETDFRPERLDREAEAHMRQIMGWSH